MLQRTTGEWQNLVETLPGSVGRKAMRFIRYYIFVRYYRNWQHHKFQCPICLLSRQFPEREDFEYGAAVGILAIQLYYNLSFNELMLKGG